MLRHKFVISLLLPGLLMTANCGNETNLVEANATMNLFEALVESTTSPNEIHQSTGLSDMEIISIEVNPEVGNEVRLSWGKPLREYDLDWTFGVYYGLSVEEASKEPKLTTKQLHAVVEDLEHCKKYIFAVGVLDANKQSHATSGYVRSIGTFVDERSPPADLRVEFIPGEEPCLLIKWSAACPNIGRPLGYLVTIYEKNPSRMTIITEPKTTSADLSQTLRVIYGKDYDFKVSTDVTGAGATNVSYRVPLFLQPYKVRLTSQPDGTFMMYWREPYVPYYVGPYHYEVYVYPGRKLTSKYEIFALNKPIFIFKGNETEYTFMVGLRSADGAFKSYLTDPIAKALDGEAATFNVS